MRTSYCVDIIPARAGEVGRRCDWPPKRLPERFADMEDAAEFTLVYLEERGWLLTEWSLIIVDEAGRIILTADDPKP